jgi:hypothetical protein
MKRIALILLAIVLFSGMVLAYNLEDFFRDMGNAFGKFFSLTGFVVLDVVKDASEKADIGMSVPEPPKVEAEKESSSEKSTDEGEKASAEDSNAGDSDKVNNADNEREDSGDSRRHREEFNVPKCSDFVDNNVNYFKKGVCKDNSGKYEDYCSSGGDSVLEYSCENNVCSGSWYVCPNGCSEGACLTKEEVEFLPDLEILAVSNYEGKLIVSVKNVGTKGTFFKTKFIGNGEEIISDVNYYLDAGEIVDVEIGAEYYGSYVVEVISDEDVNLENNRAKGILEREIEEKVTGEVVSENINVEQGKGFFDKLLDFFASIFG